MQKYAIVKTASSSECFQLLRISKQDMDRLHKSKERKDKIGIPIYFSDDGRVYPNPEEGIEVSDRLPKLKEKKNFVLSWNLYEEEIGVIAQDSIKILDIDQLYGNLLLKKAAQLIVEQISDEFCLVQPSNQEINPNAFG
jgi:hypothetical protein